MTAHSPIRLNVSIHPEKDPALFKLISSITNKDARSRRFINMATLGMYFENSKMSFFATHGATDKAPVHEAISVANESSIEALNTPTASKNEVIIEDGELDILG